MVNAQTQLCLYDVRIRAHRRRAEFARSSSPGSLSRMIFSWSALSADSMPVDCDFHARTFPNNHG